MIKQSFAEATVWKTTLPDVEHGLLPSSIPRPNPLVMGTALFVSVFSPGAVCALKRDSGALIWRRQLEGLGSDSVSYRAGKLFARTAHTLYALRPEDGRDVWSFCPYGTQDEWIYSHPAVRANRLFIGDRRGLLHCLDVDSGAPVWKAQTNRQGANVNSTPLLVDGLAIVGTNAHSVVAFDMETGRRAWKRNIDGPAVFGLLRYMGLIVVVTDSIYLLSPSTGAIQRHIGSSNWSIEYAEVVGPNLWALLRDPASVGNQRLVVCNARGEKADASTLKAMCSALRYVPKTRLAYLSHLHGVTLLDAKANVLADLSVSTDGVGVVDVYENDIYAATGRGDVYALRQPLLGSLA